jgi:hypothetical protein
LPPSNAARKAQLTDAFQIFNAIKIQVRLVVTDHDRHVTLATGGTSPHAFVFAPITATRQRAARRIVACGTMARGASEPTNDAEDAALRYWLGPKQKSHDDEPIMARQIRL